jgi:hypothetical protein
MERTGEEAEIFTLKKTHHFVYAVNWNRLIDSQNLSLH